MKSELLCECGCLDSFDCQVYLYSKGTDESSLIIQGGSDDAQDYVFQIAKSYIESEAEFFSNFKVEIWIAKPPSLWTILGRLNALKERFFKRG